MKNVLFSLMVVVSLFSACSGKNADGTPNVSTGDTTKINKPATSDTTTDSTTNAPADIKH